MADLAAIRAGITKVLSVAFPNAQVTGYLLENPYPPAFEVEIGGGSSAGSVIFDHAMSRGLDEWWFTVRGFASSGTDKGAQQSLDKWLNSTGPDSVKAALEADRTLDGTVNDSRVTRVHHIRSFEPVASPGTRMYGAEWTLHVYAPGD